MLLISSAHILLARFLRSFTAEGVMPVPPLMCSLPPKNELLYANGGAEHVEFRLLPEHVSDIRENVNERIDEFLNGYLAAQIPNDRDPDEE
jgi:hypothetical protein